MNTKRSEVVAAIFSATPINNQESAMTDAYLTGDYSELGRLVMAMYNSYIAGERWRTDAIKKDYDSSAILKGATQYELTETGKFICDDNVCRRAGVGA